MPPVPKTKKKKRGRLEKVRAEQAADKGVTSNLPTLDSTVAMKSFVFKPKVTTTPTSSLERPPICTEGAYKTIQSTCKGLVDEYGITLRQIYAAVSYMLEVANKRSK